MREYTFEKSILSPLCVLIVPALLLYSCFCSCREGAGTEKLDLQSLKRPATDCRGPLQL